MNDKIFPSLGASNHSEKERELHDYYATEPKALELLLEMEQFNNVWECACGAGHLAKVLSVLESKRRKKLFCEFPPRTVYVSSSRLNCAMNGDFALHRTNSARCYCWFVWVKGFSGDPVIKWFN